MNDRAIYAFAKVETWLEEYAKTQEMPARELISQVAGMLLNGGIKPAPSQPSRKVKGGPRAWWASLTKEERSNEMIRRMNVAQKNREKKVRPAGGVA